MDKDFFVIVWLLEIYVQNRMKYAMAPGAEVISSLYVDQKFLFRFSLQNIDKIKGQHYMYLVALFSLHILGLI